MTEEFALIPPADQVVLRKVWREFDRVRRGGERDETFLHQFSGVDFEIAQFRLSILYGVQKMPQGAELLAPWTHDGELDDAVLNAFAIVPMKRPEPGENKLTSLVDLNELKKLIEN